MQTGGGASIGGSVYTGRDFIGRDRKVTQGESSVFIGGSVNGSTIISGDGNVVTNTQALFAPIYRAIEQDSLPAQDKVDITAEVQEVEAEVQKMDSVNESFLARRLRNLKRMAPDIGELLLSALVGPGAVVSALVKKVAGKVKSEA